MVQVPPTPVLITALLLLLLLIATPLLLGCVHREVVQQACLVSAAAGQLAHKVQL
jgi:hypothetical protein